MNKKDSKSILTAMNRRGFMRTAAVAGMTAYGVMAGGCKSGFSNTLESGVRTAKANSLNKGVFAAIGGDDPAKLARAAVDMAGGIDKLVSKGDIVVIKPNIAWDRTPEQAANTNPFVVAALVEMALDAGAKQVKVFDKPCNQAKKTYSRSGVKEAAEKAGATVLFLDNDSFVKTTIPNAKVLKEWMLSRDVLESDVFINVPILKHHGATQMTAGMKNMMGCAGGDRGAWHVAELDQRIADVQLAVKPDLTVIDAFRILTDHGPVGGNLEDVKQLSTVAASTDIIAADVYAARLFGKPVSEIKYIGLGAAMNLGEMDLEKAGLKEKTIA